MEQSPKYYIVEASALPEIFQKVAEAKRMLETGETDKVNVAAQAVGISRSAFYKYRDSIAPFQNLMAGGGRHADLPGNLAHLCVQGIKHSGQV